MTNSKITSDGWTRDFDITGGDLKAAEAEASAYVDGLKDGAPGEFEINVEECEDWITVTVRKKTSTP